MVYRRISLWIVLPLLFSFLNACHDDFDQFELNHGELLFSSDTIFLNTIFTDISSSTRTLKVYNKSSANITVPSIELGRGDLSFYRLNVDGISGKSFQNIDILAKDSLYIFIEATIDFDQVNNPIYTDSIVFDSNEKMQDVKLVSLVQDAHFLYPKRNAQGIKEKIILGTNDEGEEISVEGFYLEGNTTWNNDKPYVVYGYMGVPSNSTLTINKGVNVHFHQNSGIIVDKEASLKVNGTIDEKVVFEGDRLEPSYAEVPGQWGVIWLRSGSENHRLEHMIIKNNTLGILMDSIGSSTLPSLELYNTEIYNTSSHGILARATHIKAENIVIANNGQSSLACTNGGIYNFTHSTFANYWVSGIRIYPSVLLTNYLLSNNNTSGSNQTNDLEAANFINCIIDGNQNIELILDDHEEAEFNYNFRNSMIKFDDMNGNFSDDPLYDFENEENYQLNIINGQHHYKNIEQHEFQIGQNSDAVNMADEAAALLVPFDILNASRAVNPDIGAYQHVILEE